jgi:hypothetical protein
MFFVNLPWGSNGVCPGLDAESRPRERGVISQQRINLSADQR